MPFTSEHNSGHLHSFCPYLITSYLYQSVGLDINLCGIIIIILREPLFTLMSVTFNIYSMSMYVLDIGW